MIQTIQSTITKKTYLTPDTIELELSYQEDFQFSSGQFISVTIPTAPGEKMCKRAYSIASAPQFKEGKALILCIEIVPNGQASTYFSDVAEGTALEFIGPVGHFMLKDKAAPKCFIATGTGFAPFKAMMDELDSEGTDAPLTMLFGVRYIKDVFYQEYMDEYKTTHPHFSYHIAVSRPETEWDGINGRVTDAYTQLKDSFAQETHFYLCGNGAMIDSMKDLLMENGIPKEQIFFEKYFT